MRNITIGLTAATLLGAMSLSIARADTVAPPPPPPPPLDETFNFTGDCSDCYGGHGSVSASLTVQDYVPGTELQDSNFVSFTYNGSDLFPAYTIDSLGDLGDLSGSIGLTQGYYNVSVSGNYGAGPYEYNYFYSDNSTAGDWSTGAVESLDQGTNGTWNGPAVSAAPEPAAWSLMIVGVGLTGVAVRSARRRRGVAAAA